MSARCPDRFQQVPGIGVQGREDARGYSARRGQADAGEHHEGSVKRGFYLVTIGHCMECHSPRTDGRSDLSALGKGGEKFEGRGAERVAQHHFAPGLRPRRLERRGDQAAINARRRQGRQEAAAADGLRLVARLTSRLDAIRRLPADGPAAWNKLFGALPSTGGASFLRMRRGLLPPICLIKVRILHRGAADRAVEPRQGPE